MAIRQKFESVAGSGNASEFNFIFIYTNWKLIIEKSKWQTDIQFLMFHMIIGIST